MSQLTDGDALRIAELERLRSRVAELEQIEAGRSQRDESLRIKTNQLAAVSDAMTAFLETGEWREVSAGLLASALSQTESEYGFIGVVVEGPALRILAHAGVEWDERVGRELYDNALRTYEELGFLEFTNFDNLFGRVITDRRAILSNKPTDDPRSGGLPPGHPPLRHFLGVPISRGTDVVGMIGIANRPRGYTGDEQEKIEILCNASGVLFESYRQRQHESVLEQERAQAEESLCQSELRLRHALDALAGGIWDWTVQTGHVYFSPNWSRMLGYEPGELEPHVRTWEGRLHPEDKERVLGVLNDHFNRKTSTYRSEHRMRTRSGNWIWVVDRGEVVEWDEAGNPLRMIGTDVDVTELKDAEAEGRQLQLQIEHAQKLKSLGVLAGGIAHDFNNLLTAILGHASLALTDCPEGSRAHEEIALIESASVQAAELTSQMLAYSGRGRFVVGPINLSAQVREMGRLLETAASKGVTLKYDLDDGIPLIEGDVGQLGQIIMNLITNASEAVGGESGVVALRTGVLEADRGYLSSTYVQDHLPEGSYVYVEVSDTGCGMDEETLGKLFDPFFTTKFEGRGLGLAAVLGIVRGHRGAIRIDSEPGLGTTFRVLLPRSDDDLEMTPDAPSNAGEIGEMSGTILVVEDESIVQRAVERMLERVGLTVLTANDGCEGVETFREHQDEIRAVVLDLTMPKMGGEEAFDKITEIRPGTPVILSSGHAAQDLAERFGNRGVAGFLKKPYRTQELLAKLHGVLLD